VKKTDILVIGGGAAGLMAAGHAAELGAKVILLERNDKVGRKIGITGKGRCNVTNACDERTFLNHVVTNDRFLYSAIHGWTPSDMMALLEAQGTKLKTERGNRVFPVSDRSFDIIDALVRYIRQSGVTLRTGTTVKDIVPMADSSWQVRTDSETYEATAVVLATGGLSYPSTGSTGDGHRMLRTLGHTVQDGWPGLIPFTVKENEAAAMMGLSLKNTAITIEIKGKTVYQDFGEMLFTHFGVSGPIILSGASRLQRYLRERDLSYDEAKPKLHIDCKPALSPDELDARLIRELEKNPAKQYRNFLQTLVPQKMVAVLVKRSGIPGDKKAADIGREERHRLRDLLKDMTFTLTGTRPLDEAIVTMGGLSVKEVNPKTMESKRCPGLFPAGELLDVDALTGGFNLQIAFSTGYAAGAGSAAYCAGKRNGKDDTE
jgi:hypothetical protein